MKKIYTIVLIFLTLILHNACIFQEAPDCPAKEELLQGPWRLVRVEINGEQLSGGVDEYRLFLNEFGVYERIAIDGLSDGGSWTLINDNRILVILPENQPSEEYLIETFNLRTLVLYVDRDSNKIGPDTIKLFLERV
ncbi:MAG TPA: hypothetical protein PKC24_07190 [Cyclobacteriaceae bacterium]|nr:hypothetical protein [Cyclobacteriaceae bacterium]